MKNYRLEFELYDVFYSESSQRILQYCPEGRSVARVRLE